MEESKGKSTPMERGFQYNDENPVITDVPYGQLIGGLLYLSTCTRSDITFLTSYLSGFLDKSTTQTWIAAKRIFWDICKQRNI